VAFRITVDQADRGSIVRLAGRLEHSGVAELERVVASLPGPVRLELSDLRSADAAALEALRALRGRGMTLMHASSYLRLLLGRARTKRRRRD
jgi:hypothetical protein